MSIYEDQIRSQWLNEGYNLPRYTRVSGKGNTQLLDNHESFAHDWSAYIDEYEENFSQE